MWDTRLNIVDWVCSKSVTLLATLKTLNQHQGEYFVSVENICSHRLVVQEANVSIPHFYRIGNYHLCKNDYSFDALQTNCFGINIKL